jgi:MFS family permease
MGHLLTPPVLTGPAIAYFLCALSALSSAVLLLPVQPRELVRKVQDRSLRGLLAGLHFVFNTKLLLAAITLDLFAVLLGGATALLPVYAKDILHVDALGFGFLRAAPAIGATLMALALAHRPPLRKPGQAMLLAVAAFGVATIVFGLSENFWLSLLMLALTGAFDNISVVVRGTLMQTLTPDDMRGRVGAVNIVFISSSNELGAFESGMTAKLFGTVVSVVGGGIGTIAVVIASAFIWPSLLTVEKPAGAAEVPIPATAGPGKEDVEPGVKEN